MSGVELVAREKPQLMVNAAAEKRYTIPAE